MVLAQPRSTQRYKPKQPDKDKALLKDILELHTKHPRYGYRRITIKLREKDWFVNFKRVYRLWQEEGLKVPKKQQKKRFFRGSSENACHLKCPEYRNHIWSYDFVAEKLENGKSIKILVVIDEFTRECLALDVARHFRGEDVVEVLRYLFAVRGLPDFIRSDNGSEFVSQAVIKWLEASNVHTLFVEPGSPWENGYVESFNSKLRDEFLNREIFLHIDELRYVANRWRIDYNHYRPHSSLDYMAPAAFASGLLEQGSAPLRLTQDNRQSCEVLSL